jgi:hypothetical protein
MASSSCLCASCEAAVLVHVPHVLLHVTWAKHDERMPEPDLESLCASREVAHCPGALLVQR